MSINLRNELTAIADKIREKLGTNATIKPSEFAEKIDDVHEKWWRDFETRHNNSNWAYAFEGWGEKAFTPPFKLNIANGSMVGLFSGFNKTGTSNRYNRDSTGIAVDIRNYVKLPDTSQLCAGAFGGALIQVVPSINFCALTAASYSSNAFSSDTITEIVKIKMDSRTGMGVGTSIGYTGVNSPFVNASSLTTIRFDAHDSSGNGLIKTNINMQWCPLSHDTLYKERVINDSTYGNYSGLIQALYDFAGNNETPSSSQGKIKLSATAFGNLSNEEIAVASAKGWTIGTDVNF